MIEPRRRDATGAFFVLQRLSQRRKRRPISHPIKKRPMVDWLAHLELAIRHVTEGEARVARQRELIARLKRLGHPTDQSEKLLELLENALQQMIWHKEFIKAWLTEGEA
jgi:truncated hemoglobin YjbI